MQMLREVAMARAREKGSNNLGCMLGLVLVIVVVFIGVKAVPARLSVAELQDFCEHEAEQASLPRFSDERIAEASLGLPSIHTRFAARSVAQW